VGVRGRGFVSLPALEQFVRFDFIGLRAGIKTEGYFLFFFVGFDQLSGGVMSSDVSQVTYNAHVATEGETELLARNISS